MDIPHLYIVVFGLFIGILYTPVVMVGIVRGSRVTTIPMLMFAIGWATFITAQFLM